jgi:membrane-bound lytic murein transglycosylase D
VRFKSPHATGISLILLAITGCSNIPPAALEQAGVETTAVAETARRRVPVLESLVQEAARRSELPLPGVTDQLDRDSEIIPVTTTIPMTPNRVVERTINNLLQNNRGVLRAWAERSQIYFPMIEQIFEEEGVPDELKYLAIGESGLNPTVRSSAGAVGMWQFMPLTARSEGLRVDEWVDERRDPEKATRAAARHLKKLNEDYNGRWHLSVAGYNCSYRCITRAVKNAGYSMEDPPSYWEVYTHLPKETRDFVPKFIATALLISNPALFGIDAQDLGEELAYDVVQVRGMLSLQDAARLAGTDLPTIRKLNPSLLRTTLPADNAPFDLKIPLGSHDLFVRNFTQEAPQSVSGSGQYVVKSGDTLGKIAQVHGVSVKELQMANGIDSHLININQKLNIPGKSSLDRVELLNMTRQSVAYDPSPSKPIELGEEFTLVHQSGSTPEKPLLAVSLNLQVIQPEEGAMNLVPTVYRVQRGDTLGGIAQRFGVSVASIQANNNMNNALIFPNQELTIHSATNIMDAPVVEDGRLTYQVQSGDNLYVIARRFNKSVDHIKRVNGLGDNMIHPGQSLRVD